MPISTLTHVLKQVVSTKENNTVICQGHFENICIYGAFDDLSCKSDRPSDKIFADKCPKFNVEK